MKRLVLVAAACAFGLTCRQAVRVLSLARGRTAGEAKVGQMAPDFHLTDAAGRRWQLRGLAGQPVALVFACGCADCKRLLHSLARSPRPAEQVLVITSIYPEAANRLVSRFGRRFPCLFDPFSETARAYRSTTCPRVWVIDSNQIIRYTNSDPRASPDAIVRAAARALALQPVTVGVPARAARRGARWR